MSSYLKSECSKCGKRKGVSQMSVEKVNGNLGYVCKKRCGKEVRFVDAMTDKKVADSVYLMLGQTYDIPTGFIFVSKEIRKDVEIVLLRKE